MSAGWQAPVGQRSPRTVAGYLKIICHPAFRLGVIDAFLKREFSSDRIADRIANETPADAVNRLRWLKTNPTETVCDQRASAVELAQYRYEEGRLLVRVFNLKCCAWKHPDFPPQPVADVMFQMVEKTGGLRARMNSQSKKPDRRRGLN